MPQEVIDRVHDIARKQIMPEGFIYIRCDGSVFEDIPGEQIHDNNNNINPADNDINIQPDEDDDNITIDDEEVHEDVGN